MPPKTVKITVLDPYGDLKSFELLTETNKNLAEYARAIMREGHLADVKDEKGRLVQTDFYPPHRVVKVSIK